MEIDTAYTRNTARRSPSSYILTDRPKYYTCNNYDFSPCPSTKRAIKQAPGQSEIARSDCFISPEEQGIPLTRLLFTWNPTGGLYQECEICPNLKDSSSFILFPPPSPNLNDPACKHIRTDDDQVWWIHFGEKRLPGYNREKLFHLMTVLRLSLAVHQQ